MDRIKSFFVKYKLYIFVVIAATLLITVCSCASFLFPIHHRVDQNIFYTLGRGIIDGKVPYRDLFEHKGPLIYFMHAFAALIDRNSFIGIYFLEVAFFAVTLYYTFKSIRLFTTERASYIATAISGALMCTTYCFKVGDNAEEFCFAFLMVGLYHLLRYFKAADKDLLRLGRRNYQGNIGAHTHLISYKVVLVNGILAGCVLWIKFVLLGFWIAWMAVVFFVLFLQKDYKRAFLSCAVFLGGMALTTLPWLVYFGINNAIGDWFETYFYNNIVLYAHHISLWERIKAIWNSFRKDFWQNPLIISVILLGLVQFGIMKKYVRSFFARFGILLTFFTLYILLYGGGVRYDYYMLICVPFCLFGVAAIVDTVRTTPDLLPVRKLRALGKKSGFAAPAAICFTALYLYVIFASNAFPYYGKDRSDYPQYMFADIINQKEDATLLNYGFIDGGFYLASGIEPINRFFCKVNIIEKVFPEMYEEQIGMVADKKVDFVVIRIWKDQSIEEGMRLAYEDLFNNYKIIAAADDPFENYRFFLLEKKDLLA